MTRNITIGITGGIGTGKSVVSRVLRCNGFKVYDCDSEAKRLMRDDAHIKQTLIDHFGKDIYLENGMINKSALASIIFQNEKELLFVNKIVHAAVREDIERKRKDTPGLFFIESAILASSNVIKECQIVWVVNAPLKVRLKRIEARDHTSEEDIKKRINSQRKELNLLNGVKTVNLVNDNRHPLLIKILKETEKLENKN
ncbi:MAG: dephospho-CoA kinase [Muribaculaceae bacterium]|nr:dephospho-CoA kinase [Muribaculaceae bacterium]